MAGIHPDSGAVRDRRIRSDDVWAIAASSARSEIRDTPFGTDEMCEQMGGVLTHEFRLD